MITPNTIREVADSVVRIYGREKAQAVAVGYAATFAEYGDQPGHERWAAIAAQIAQVIELDQRFRKAVTTWTR